MTEASISALLAAIPMPALLVGHGERVIAANSLTAALLGPAITGRHFITVIRQPAVLDAVENCLGDHQVHKTQYLASRGGQEENFEVTCTYVDTALGQGAVVVFHDITELTQAEQMRRDFVANVSHELRTPLTALIGFIETLLGPAKDDEAVRARFLGIMANEAGRMERLVRDLLSLSQVEGEARVRPTERVEILGLMESVRNALAPLARDADVELEITAEDGPVEVKGDSDQLRQVLTNLVENAIKYGRAGKRVEMTLSAVAQMSELQGQGVAVTVRDHGAGIDEIHIPRLTERFYRVDSHRSREMGGTGLGLAIVKHIVNRHRGRMRISSVLGEGTSIRIVLPLG
ncbi:two-component system, OmpR family, phosphate regulon sensor histidine kinase PhoR [Pseudooceanicola antarcticus]|uniref:histidine kinase n=1 Tax=Pseudooceanicola antarcticus TaxID=1247613 RepID=A0A285IY42_9RHOB|nr:ATP-binding protein [Pseudooceanicola antarcticus]PJE25782.1 two-component sensor histidine kinase [Pseudooceanicola antarcticus]SNY52878.1 two-component system, OmpR family, phosphate regulon sensor histidine kinase PhoR [Pseudooceanicola antarcticus]